MLSPTPAAKVTNASEALGVIDGLYLFYLAAMALLAYLRLPGWPRIVLLHAVIAAVILLLAARARHSRIAAFLHQWYPLAMFIFSFEEVARFSLAISSQWQDPHIIGFEAHLFTVSPNLWLGRFTSPWLSELMNLGYFSYYPMFPVVGGLIYAREDKSVFRRLVLSAVLMYFISFAVYLGFPTEGPRHALSNFQPPPHGAIFSWLVRTIQGGAGVHGNAFPSSHVALAVICTAFAWRYLSRTRAFFTICTCLICLSAVYDGYHYLSDVVAGALIGWAAVGCAGRNSSPRRT